MIDAKDLMVENYLQKKHDKNSGFYKVKSVMEGQVFFSWGNSKIENFEPILLTEDILVNNCGAREIYKSKYSHILELENYPEIQFKNINNTGVKVIFKDIYLENIGLGLCDGGASEYKCSINN